MVRLLQVKAARAFLGVCTFQSHNGAIAAMEPGETLDEFIEVSIPQWCDCCQGFLAPIFAGDEVSIPQWCDCCRFLMEVKVPFRIVSIPQWCDCCFTIEYQGKTLDLCFNPTMVRLLLYLKTKVQFDSRKFQSHNGAIAAIFDAIYNFVCAVVSIPQWCDCC